MANETILIVDAEAKSQKVLEVSFKKAGYRVEIAGTLADARAYLEDSTPVLIIANTQLPDGDGLAFCADLNLNSRTQDIPLIFLTRDRSVEQKMRSFELGADDYLTKPIYIKEVTTRAQLLIQRRDQQQLRDSDVEQFEGNLDEITMIDLLQTIEEELRTGSIRVFRRGKQAAVYFHQGNVVDAVCGKLQGEDAVYRIMRWPQGQFVVRYHDEVRRADHIEKDASTLLMEGMRRLDQWNELIGGLPELDRVFEADYRSLPNLVDSLPTEVERILRLFDGYRTLEQVVDDSPLDDTTTLQIIDRLLRDELLVDVADSGPSTAPRMDATGVDSNLDDWLETPEKSEPASPFATVDEQSEEQHGDDDDPDDNTDRISRPPVGEFEQDEQTRNDTDELNRPPSDDESSREHDPDDAPTPERHGEPGSGGGHWQFHWGGDRAERPQSVDEPPPGTDGDISDSPSEQSDHQEAPDGLDDLEQQELLRRQEEARRLAEQRSDSESPEPVTADTGADVDDGRQRRITPVSAPAVSSQADLQTSEQHSDAITDQPGVPEEASPREDDGSPDTPTGVKSAPIDAHDEPDEHPPFDEDVTETTDEHVPPELLVDPEPMIERHAENGKIVSSRYDLSDSPAPPPAPELLNHDAPVALQDPDAGNSQAAEELKEILGLEDEDLDFEEDDEPDADHQLSDESAHDRSADTSGPEPEPDPSPEQSDRPDDDANDVDTPVEPTKESEPDDQHEPAQASDKAEQRFAADDDNVQTDDRPSETQQRRTEPTDKEPTQQDSEPDEQTDDASFEHDAESADDAPEDDSEALVDSSSEGSFFEEGDSLHEFDDDFEEQFQSESSWWRPVLVATLVFAVGAIVIGGLVIVGDDEPEEPEEEVAEATEPQQDDVIAVGEQQDEPEQQQEEEDQPDDQLDEARDEAESLARQGSWDIEFAAEGLAENIVELEEEQEAEEQEDPEEPVEEQPDEEVAEAPVEQPEPEGPDISDDLDELRTLVAQESPEGLGLARDLSEHAGDEPEIALLHGQAAYNDGEDAEALEQLQRAERLGYITAELYLQKGNVHFALQQPDQAQEAFEQFLDIAPDHPRAGEIESILEGM